MALVARAKKRRGAENKEHGEEPSTTSDAKEPPKSASTTATKTRKRRRDEGKDIASESAAATAEAKGPETLAKPASTEAAGASRKRRRNNKGDAAVGEASAVAEKARETEAVADDERRRRDVQREIRNLVVQLRKEGKGEREIHAAKYELKKKHGHTQNPDSNRSKKKKAWQDWLQSENYQAQQNTNRLRQHDLVVIPVFWRGRHDKLDVQGAAEDLKACISQQGVDVWVDSRRHYTPGQKFAHWEYRGVMLRVEVGPDDLKAGVCRVCRAKTPGDYQSVEQKRVRLPPAGARQLLLLLKEWGLSQIEIERREGDSDDDEDAEVAAEGKPAAGVPPAQAPAQHVDEEELDGNWASAFAAAKPKKQKPKRGTKRRRRPRRTTAQSV